MRSLLFLCLFGLLALAGCKTLGDRSGPVDPDATIKVPFDPAPVQHIASHGTAQVTGKVALTTSKGDVVAEGADLRLVPVAEYSQAVMKHLFQGRNAHFERRQIAKLDPRYSQYMRASRSDAEGRFVFKDVPAGEYFIYATGTNKKDGSFLGLMETVKIGDGEHLRVDLDGV